MWTALTVLILAAEVILLISFVVGRFRKRKFNETALFLGTVFVVNLSLYIVPFLHGAGADTNIVLGILTCVGYTLRSFLFDANVRAVTAFAEAVPLFTAAYSLGAMLALLATVSTAVEMFSNSVRNGFRLSRALRKDSCDIVVGNSPKALQYAQNCNGVLLLDDTVSKEGALELMEAGFVVLRRSFTATLFRSRQFNTATRYNIICADREKALDYIDTFIACKKACNMRKDLNLYVEISADKAETVHREIIEKSGLESCITTYCTEELLARAFTEEYPITCNLPAGCIEQGAIRSDAEIHTWYLGFGSLNRELYRQSVMHNQLVTFENGTYRVKPIFYHLCDICVDTDEWNINGLAQALADTDADACFPLPELPCKTEVLRKNPHTWEVLAGIKKQVQCANSHTRVIIDTGDDCRNIELGARLKSMLPRSGDFHIFVRSEASFTHDDERVTYFGKSDSVFTHDVIVDDSLSLMARKLNEVYTAQYAAGEKDRPDFVAYVREKARADWEKLDHFTMYSNIFAAMNLRLKLNLLGLAYVPDGRAEGMSLVAARHGHKGKYPYEAYFTPSVRNALIAQEHARWNAYHLLNGYLPLPKAEITEKSRDGQKVRFVIKDAAAKKHACLTTYQGLDTLSSHLAALAGDCTAADYDYYIYDEMLITATDELLESLGCSVTER